MCKVSEIYILMAVGIEKRRDKEKNIRFLLNVPSYVALT